MTHNIFSISHKLVKLASSQERKVKSFCEWKIWRFSRSFESRVTLNLNLLAQTQRYSSRTFKETFIRLKRMGFKTTERPSSKVNIFLFYNIRDIEDFLCTVLLIDLIVYYYSKKSKYSKKANNNDNIHKTATHHCSHWFEIDKTAPISAIIVITTSNCETIEIKFILPLSSRRKVISQITIWSETSPVHA